MRPSGAPHDFSPVVRPSLDESVRVVADAWVESPYYANAERLLHVFWGEKSPFLPLFEELDLANVLDLACGHGRHTEQIVHRATAVVLMDVHESNIRASRGRLGNHNHLRFIVNNGYDFRPIRDAELTAIFCYDAMVHFAPDVVASYLRDTSRVLPKGGLALYHHSNLSVPNVRNYALNPGARNNMSRSRFQHLALDAGLEVVESHIIAWGGVDALDCVTLLAKP
jgi:SAM-dependent methyltransferase